MSILSPVTGNLLILNHRSGGKLSTEECARREDRSRVPLHTNQNVSGLATAPGIDEEVQVIGTFCNKFLVE